MKILLFSFISILSGICYRVGGSSLNMKMKTKVRDFGVPLCGVIVLSNMMPCESFWYYISLFSFFLFSFGSLTTYWEHWKSEGVEWFEFALTGFFYGMAALPVAIYSGRYIGFILRTIILTIFMPFSNKFQLTIFSDPTDGVEGSRGFVFIATMPLLLL